MDSSCQITTLGDFNIRDKDWLPHPSDTTMGREAEAFAIIDNLCQLVQLLARISDRLGDRGHTLNVILTSILSSFSATTSLSPLSSCDHWLTSFSTSLPQLWTRLLALRFCRLRWFSSLSGLLSSEHLLFCLLVFCL